MTRLSKLRASGALTALAVSMLGLSLLAGGTAYAYWSTPASGTGTATASAALSLVSSKPVVTGQLVPGGQAATATMSVTNPNPFPVEIISLSFGTAVTTKSGCTTTGVTFRGGSALGVAVPSGGTYELTYTAQMSTDSLNACQGASFTAPYTIEAVSK